MNGENKRRYIPIIHRTYQYRFLAFTITYMIIVVFFMAAFVFVPEFMQMTDPHASFEVQSMAADKILYGHAKMWPFLFALIFLIGVHSLRVFARFVGPLYQFTRAFEKIAGGDLGFRVQIRKGDYLTEERDGINDMIESLADRVEQVRLAKDEILWTLDRLEKETAAQNPDSAPAEEPQLGELRGRVEKLTSALASFTLQGPGKEEEKESPNGDLGLDL
jgi:methyl-accepting chemotaxis protein